MESAITSLIIPLSVIAGALVGIFVQLSLLVNVLKAGRSK